MTIAPPDRVLLTGATGSLGRYILSQLSESGYHVVATTWSRDLPDHLARRCVKVLRGDLSDTAFLRDAVRGVDGICHAAAYVPSDHRAVSEARRCLEVNALATLKLGELAAERDVRRLVYIGAGNAYVPSPVPVREDGAQYPSTDASYYLTSKMVGEIYLDHLRTEFGLPVVSLRASSIYGISTGRQSVVQLFVDQASSGGPIQVDHEGLPAADHVYAADVAWCVGAALTGGSPGAYNVGSGQAWSLRELAEMVADVFAPVPIVATPASRPRPRDFPALDVGKAAAAWGYRPSPLREGLQRLREETGAWVKGASG